MRCIPPEGGTPCAQRFSVRRANAMNGQPIDLRSKAMSLLTKQEQATRARLRLYIGAAPGVGKTYQMLEEAHLLKRQGADIVIGFIEPHGRADTEALVGDLEQVPLKII